MAQTKRPLQARGLAAVALIAFGAAVAQGFGRFTFGLLLPALRDDLGISNTGAGFIGTINVGAYLLGTLAVAWATSRFKLLLVLRAGLVVTTVGLLLAAWSPNPAILGAAMFLTGVGGALIWIPSPAIAADSLAPERRGLAVGLMGSGIGIGIVFSSQLSSWVRSSKGDDSWRTVFQVQAGLAVVAVAATALLIRHVQAQPAGASGGFGGFSALQRMNGWKALTLAYASFGFMYLLIIAFLTTRLEDDNGWSSSRASLAFTAVGLATIFGGPVFIAFARRVGVRFALALAFTLWSAMALLVLPGWFPVTLLVAAAIGFLFSAIPGMITLYVVENAKGDDYGPSFAAATLAFGVAQMLAPQVGGLVADLSGSFTLVFVLSAALAITGTMSALQLPRHGSTS